MPALSYRSSLQFWILALVVWTGLKTGMAATLTWTGSAGDGLVSNANNWSPVQAPVGGDTLIYAGTASLAPQLTAGLSINSLTFSSGASSFTLGGAGTYTISSGITNSSSNLQTINNAIILSAAQTWSATSGALALGGNVANGGFLLTISGGNATTLGGVLSGTGGLTKSGTGTLTLNGTNTYSGNTTLSAGTTAIGNNAAFGTSALTFGGGIIATSGGARTLTNNISVTANTTFTAANDLTLNGTISLTASRTFTVSGAGIITFGGVVSQASGSRRLTKSGTGTLVLNGANTFGGGLTVSAGTIILGSNTAAGSGTLSMGTATFQASGGTRTLTNAVSITGNTTFSGANDFIFSGAATMTSSRTLTINNSSVTFNGVFGQSSSTARTLTKNGAGTLTLGGTSANTYTGSTIVNDGTLVLNKTAGVNAFGGTVLTVGDGSGNASSAVVQLNAANQMPDATAITVKTDGLLNLQGFTDTIGTLTMNGGLVSGTSGNRLDLGGNVTITASGTATAAIAANVGLNGSRTFTVNDNSVTTDNDLSVSGIISDGTGASALTKAGTGTMILSGTNTFTGGSNINAGTVLLDNNAALGTAAANLGDTTGTSAASLLFSTTAGRTVTNNIVVRSGSTGTATLGGQNTSGINTFGGTVTLNKNATVTAATGGEVDFNGIISGTGFGLTKTGEGIVKLGAANTYTGLTTISAGTLAYGVSNALATGAVTIDGATAVLNLGANQTDSVGQVILANGGSITGSGTSALTSTATFDLRSGSVSIPLSGTVGLTKSTTGTVTLSGVNTYTLGTSITAGTLRTGVASSIPSTSAVSVSSGAVFDLNNFNQNIGSLTGAGSVTLGSATLTAGSDNTSTSFSGAISGTGGLTKAGSGIFTVSGANNYSGATTVSAGTLRVGAASTLPSQTQLSVSGGATFDLNSIATTVGSLAGAGSVTLGSASLTTGVNNGSTSFSGVISGTGGLVKDGSGTQTLTGTNTFSGALTISNGGVVLSGAGGSTASASSVVVATGASLTLDNSAGENTNRISNSASITLGGGAFNLISDSNGSTETVGSLNASSGASSVVVTHNGSASDSTSLTFSSLGTITPGATVNFSAVGGTLGGGVNGPHIFITGQANGLIGGWATVGSDFADYSTNGVIAFNNYYLGTDGINVNDPTKVVLLSSTSPASAYTLTNALTTTDLGLNVTDLTTVDLGASNTRTLNLAGGGLIKSAAPASTISGQGRLTAGGTANGTLAVTVDTSRQLTISSTIIDNAGSNSIYGDAGDGVVSLAKAGSGTLVLSGTNTYTGGNFLNAGTVQISSEANLGAAANDVTFGGGTLNVTTGFTASTTKVFSVASDLTGTLDISSGQTLTLGNASELLITGNTVSELHKAGSGDLVVQGANTGFDGFLSIDAGSVELRNAQSLGDATNRGRIHMNSGTLKLRNDSNTNFANDMTMMANSTIDVGRLTGTTPAVTHTLGTLSIGAQTLTTTGSNGAALSFSAGWLTGNATFNPTTADLSMGAISGSFGITKSGAGAFILNAANTYTGGTTVTAGTLRTAIANSIPSTSAVSVSSGAVVDFNSFNQSIGSLSGAGNVTLGSATLTAGNDNSSTTYSGVISGTGGLTKVGSGTMTLMGANTYTGTTTINAGTLRLGAAGVIADSSLVSVNVTVGGTFDLNGFNETVGPLTGGGNVTLGSGTLTTTVSSGTSTFAGSISGTGGLTKKGAGTLAFTGTNSYSGTTNIDEGVLLAQITTALGDTSGGTNVASGAELQLADGTSIGAESLTLRGTGTTGAGALRVVSGNASYGGSISVAQACTIGADSGSLTLGGSISLAEACTLTGAGSITADGVISGTGGIVKNGTGVLTFTAANTYAGTTQVNSGTLLVHNNTALGATGAGNGTTVASGASLQINNAAGISVGDEPLILNGDGISGGGALDSVLGSNLWAGLITLASNSTIDVEADSLTLSGGVAESGGSRSLTKNGAGTLVVNGSNTYTGPTLINAGTLQLGSSNRLSDSSALTIASGATFDLNDFDETIGSLAGAGTVDFGDGATASLTLGGDGSSTTFSGTIIDSGDLIKVGAGTLTLSGTNTFVGNVFLNAGVLSVGADANLGAAANPIDFGGGTLRLTSTVSMTRNATLSTTGTIDTAGVNSTFGGVISGSGSFVKIGAGTLNLTAANTYTGSTTVSAGTLNVSSGGAIAGTNVTVASTGTLTVASGGAISTSTALTANGAVNFNNATTTIASLDGASTGVVTLNSTNITVGSGTYAGVIQNGGSTGRLTKTGTGTLTLSGANTYTNGTVLNGGTLALASSSAIGSSGTISFGGGTLQYSASNTTDYSARFSNAASQAYSLDTNGQNVTLATALTSSGGSLTKLGTGRLTLTGSNTWSGATTVNAGTLQVGVAGAGKTGPGVLTVGDGTNAATLAGTGTIDGTNLVTNHVVRANATVAPGDNGGASNGALTVNGNLNLNNNSVTQLQLTTRTTSAGNYGGNQPGTVGYNTFVALNVGTWNGAAAGNHDTLNVNGTLTLGTNTAGLFQVLDNGYVANAQLGDIFDLLDWSFVTAGSFNAGTNFRSGGLGGGNLLLPDLSSKNLAWDVSQFTTSGILMVIVPEPSRVFFVLVGLMAGLLRRRRK